MANTTFSDFVTPINASWCNDVNDTVYEALGNGSTAPTTAAQVRANLNVPQRNGTDASGNWPINSQNVTGTVAIANGGTGETSAVNAFNAIKQIATETISGVLEIATQTEAEAGTADSVAMTPLKVEQHMTANALGWGQTWQNVSGSRANNTDYTNSTGRPIVVNIYGSNATASCVLQISFNSGTTWMSFGGSALPSGTALALGNVIVPSGATYRVRASAGTLAITEWWELR